MNDLLPKTGTETSSFKVAAVSALSPFLALLVVIIGLALIDEPRVREALLTILYTVIAPGILAGGAVAFKYIGARGDVAVAKVEAYKAINAPASSNSLSIEQGTTKKEGNE